MPADLTDGLDRKGKIVEHVWKEVPEPRDQWGDGFQGKCEGGLATACHSTAFTLGVPVLPAKGTPACKVIEESNDPGVENSSKELGENREEPVSWPARENSPDVGSGIWRKASGWVSRTWRQKEQPSRKCTDV